MAVAPQKSNLREKALKRNGPAGPFGGLTMLDRMGDKFTVGDGCWLWHGKLSPAGYGRIGARRGVTLYAHRVMYELLVGPIPGGLELDHLCRVRHCVNPGHLEAVPGRENRRRSESPLAKNARKTHCLRDHLFDEANTIHLRGGTGRACRACRKVYKQRYKLQAQQREQANG